MKGGAPLVKVKEILFLTRKMTSYVSYYTAKGLYVHTNSKVNLLATRKAKKLPFVASRKSPRCLPKAQRSMCLWW